jgi:hypothetical protein
VAVNGRDDDPADDVEAFVATKQVRWPVLFSTCGGGDSLTDGYGGPGDLPQGPEMAP